MDGYGKYGGNMGGYEGYGMDRYGQHGRRGYDMGGHPMHGRQGYGMGGYGMTGRRWYDSSPGNGRRSGTPYMSEGNAKNAEIAKNDAPNTGKVATALAGVALGSAGDADD